MDVKQEEVDAIAVDAIAISDDEVCTRAKTIRGMACTRASDLL